MKKIEQEGEQKNYKWKRNVIRNRRPRETVPGHSHKIEARLKKVVASKQLRLAVETEEERRARLENDIATKRLRLAMETDEERKARLEKMVATTQPRLALETRGCKKSKKKEWV